MKKILVLTMMVLLVASMSVMASDVTISGQVQYEWLQDFDTLYDYNGDAELVAKATVDDYNTATIDFDYAQDAGPASTSMIQLDKAYFTTAIGKYLGVEEMGVSITSTWGWYEWGAKDYAKVTGYENEQVFDDNVENWEVNFDVGIMDMVHVVAGFAPEPAVQSTMFGAYGGMDPVWVEAYYLREAESMDQADIGLGVNFGMDIMPGMYAFDIGLSFRYNLDSDAVDGDVWALGAGLSNTIMDMIYLNVGFAGNDDSIFVLLWFEAGADYEGMIGADLGVGMIMDDTYAPETLDEIDISVWTKVGAATFRVGYIMVTEDNGVTGYYEGLNAPSDADFDPTVASGAVYVSGTLDF
jgi:hypothetical protein